MPLYYQVIKRVTKAALLLALITCFSSGPLYFLSQQPSVAEAAGSYSLNTGYYLGSGTTRSITGLGFKPELIIIKSDTASGPLVWKSSAMPENVSTYLGVATADNTEGQITFDDDGFTVSGSAEVNASGVNYTFVAFAGSDCSATGVMCVGKYTGDSNTTQAVDTGFKPDLVWVKRTTALAGVFRTSSMTDNQAAFFSATANNAAGAYFTTLDNSGFTAGSLNNSSAGVYYYAAFKNVTGRSIVGQFTGNGVDNRNITGLGFEPDFVLVKQDSAVVPAFNTTEMYGDYSSVTTAAASAVNHIQELQSDGFQVGNSTSVNANGIVSYYFAFGGAPDPTPSGTFLMQRGSYTGTGVARTIDTSFSPNLVIVKGDTAQAAVWSTSLHGDGTEYFGVTGPAFTGGINIVSDQDGFDLGTHATVNGNGIAYEYVAFGNATTPRRGDGAQDFYIGSYTGNGLDGRIIDHLGFTPSMVVVKRSNGTANQSVWKTTAPTMATNTAAYFSNTADNTAGALLQGMLNGGFTLGSNAATNAVGATYVWFAFAEGDNFKVGSYAGNSTVGRDITGVGFAPDLVWTKRDTNSVGVMRSSSLTLTGDTSQHFTALPNDVNDITALTADGFTVGNSAEANTTGGNYRYAAWHSNLSMHVPDQPVNTAPAAGAVDQDLATTLVGSTYADTDSNAQVKTEWQVDDDENFASPVWTRSSSGAETSIAVNGTNGTFANELAGQTELQHQTTYYWRVRYSDNSWSTWSAATSFTTNTVATPANLSPADGASVRTLTPVLTASAFSDPQAGHTASSSQWQIAANSNFTTNQYDSGPTAYGISLAVPAATLSDRNAYFWRVRYQDSTGTWSSWSEPSRFLVEESPVVVTPLFGNTAVDPGDQVNIDVQVKHSSGNLINDATVALNIYDPDGARIVDGGTMAYISGSKAVYRYSYVTSTSTTGSYLYEVTATTSDAVGYGAANFQVKASGGDTSSLEAISEDILTNVELLISGLIVVQSSVQDTSASATVFKTALPSALDDFYTNGTLVFTSGDLDGLVRRISDYDGTTKTVTIDPPAPIAPGDGDSFTITSQNLQASGQLIEVKNQLSAIESKIDIIDTNIDTVLSEITTIQNSLSTVATDLNSVRASQQKHYDLELTNADTVPTTGTYRAALTIRDFESNPADATTTPRITIYDPERTVMVNAAAMTKDAAGVYSYSYEIPSGAIGGVWESRVEADPDGGGDLTLVDIWSLSGSPAEVSINKIADLTVPDIMAYATITNEGGTDQEYNYTWCVVAAESNPCGGDDDVYTASAAKLLAAGESFATSLAATVPNAGTYWFKLAVDYGSGTSGAALQFTAVDESSSEPAPPDSGGGSSSGSRASEQVTISTLSRDIQSLRTLIESNAAKLSRAIELIGNVDPSTPGFRSLLELGEANFQNVNQVQNKVTEIRTLTEAAKQIMDGGAAVKVTSFLEWGSVKFGFLITNPANVEQTIDFKSYLPEEVKPEHVLDLDSLQLDFDPATNRYYVHGSITLGPKDSIVKKVRVEDIWKFDEKELQSTKEEAHRLAGLLTDTQYEVPATLLLNDIDNTVDAILLRQQDMSEPQVHILNYHDNKLRLARLEENKAKLQELVVQYNASKGIFGRLSGIEITSTWIIVAAIILGFLLLSAFLMMMWRHQMRFAERMLANRRREASQDEEAGLIGARSSARSRTMRSVRNKNYDHDDIGAN